MKIYSAKFKIALLFGVIMILAIFIAKPVFSQETAKKESHKKIVMKIISDDNGKTTIIDTTMEVPDSTMIDSVKKEIEKVIVLGNGGKHARYKIRSMPDEFNYNFEIPPVPECPMDLEELKEFEFEGISPCREMEECFREQMEQAEGPKVIRMGGHRQTLSDILGDIPMDRVVSYSIKDRKNGKRITIDLNDAPLFEEDNRVIVIRDPERKERGRNHPERRMKVYINSGDEKSLDQAPEPPAPPSVPPPPPPPANQPEKTSPKKPKI
jgi:hypothetical protein